MKETIKAGIAVTQRAIQENNVAELGRCIARFKALQAGADSIQEALLQCPASLLFKAGYDVMIRSQKLATDVLLSDAINSLRVRHPA